MRVAMQLVVVMLLAAAAAPTATKVSELPDKEMLRMMDFLKEMEMIKQLDMLQELQRVDGTVVTQAKNDRTGKPVQQKGTAK